MDPLVSVAWLVDHLHDPDLVVVDATLPPVGAVPVVDTHARYLAHHIPGAIFFDIDALSDHSTSLPHMLPFASDFANSMGALGIADTNRIVIYEQQGVFSAPRAWWMLRTMGAAEVFLLDGDLQAWIAAGQRTSSGPGSRPPASFHATRNDKAIQDFMSVQKLLASHAQIVDARSAGRFEGSAPEPRPGLPSGHMPGAVSVPFTEMVANGRLKTAEEICQVFDAHGVDLGLPITTTCGSGVTAAVLALALERCGATQVSLYDGSWAEYASRPEAVIVKDTA